MKVGDRVLVTPTGGSPVPGSVLDIDTEVRPNRTGGPERRATWVRVLLDKGRATWFPISQVERDGR